MDPSYSEYVKYLSREWPNLEPLSELLTGSHQRPEVKEAGCHIACLQFQADGNTYYTRLDADRVVDVILDFTLNSEVAKTAGICILVEDIEPRVIDDLGGALDINPHFFLRTHREKLRRDREKPSFVSYGVSSFSCRIAKLCESPLSETN